MISLGRKYPTIPEKYMLHYPKRIKEVEDELKQENEDKPKRKRKQKKQPGVVKKRRVGRPRKIQAGVVPKGQSIMRFFSVVKE